MIDFPQLLPHEQRIYSKFRVSPEFPGGQEIFGLHLGEGISVDPAWPAWLQSQARRTTQKRVDVLLRLGDRDIIVELKRRAGLSAVGQLLGYRNLWIASGQSADLVELWVVAEDMAPDIISTYAEFEIRLILVPAE